MPQKTKSILNISYQILALCSAVEDLRKIIKESNKSIINKNLYDLYVDIEIKTTELNSIIKKDIEIFKKDNFQK